MPEFSAIAQGKNRVRVTKASPFADVTDGAAGALNTALWRFDGQVLGNLPAAPVEVLSVSLISTTVVDIVATEELSFGRTYLVTAHDDMDGVVPPDNTAAFVAFTPAEPSERDWTLHNMLPFMNFREDDSGDTEKFVNVLQEVANLLVNKVDEWGNIIDPDVAPENFVNAMLSDMGNSFTFITLTLVQKRRLARLLLPIAKQKGTQPGIENAIRLLVGFDSDAAARNTFGALLGKVGQPRAVLGKDVGNPGTLLLGAGGPYDMAVMVATPLARLLTADEEEKVREVVRVMRPASVHFTLLRVGLSRPSRIKIEAGPGANDSTITYSAVADADDYRLHLRLVPEATQFNTIGTSLGLVTSTVAPYTPGTPEYYVVTGYLTTGGSGSGAGGLRSAEVRSEFGPVASLAATPTSGKVTLTWDQLVGATQYRIYRRASTGVDPLNGDLLATIDGDVLTYEDTVPSGAQFYYTVVAVDRGAAGYAAAQVTATAL